MCGILLGVKSYRMISGVLSDMDAFYHAVSPFCPQFESHVCLYTHGKSVPRVTPDCLFLLKPKRRNIANQFQLCKMYIKVETECQIRD